MERFIKMLWGECAHVIAYRTSDDRNHWLPRYLGINNRTRCHMALGGFSPMQCLQRLVCWPLNSLE